MHTSQSRHELLENHHQQLKAKSKNVRYWLIGFLTLVLLMIAIGGITRMTRSGLSITEWRPIAGAIPPLSEAQWLDEFDKYKNTPEFKKINNHFTVTDYKSIYLWEYLHRLLGRVLFLYAIIPGIFLWRKKKISLHVPVFLSTYIAFQGLVGWIMVKSGLNIDPFVSPFLLATHYFLALGLLTLAFYYLCHYRRAIKVKLSPSLSILRAATGIALGVQIFYGCLMSGYRAGYLSDTFPQMNNELIPGFIWNASLSTAHLLESPFIVHWVHRWLGLITLALIVSFVLVHFKLVKGRDRRPFIHFLGITSTQVLIGITLIKLHIPVFAAIAHQSIAALIVLAYFNIIFRSQKN